MSVIPVLHNVVSAQRVIEASRVVFGLGYRTFVVSKATGSAAQTGVPEAQKLALKKKLNFIFLADLEDVLELLNPDIVLTVMPRKYGGEPLDNVWSKEISQKDRVILVFGGAEPGLTMREMKMGKLVYPKSVDDDIGSVGLMAITLYIVKNIT